MITSDNLVKVMMVGFYAAYFSLYAIEQVVTYAVAVFHPIIKMGKARLLDEIDICRVRLKTGNWAGMEAGKSTEDIVSAVVPDSHTGATVEETASGLAGQNGSTPRSVNE